MSVIFATVSEREINICADKQQTNMITGEITESNVTKIKKWSPGVVVGYCGVVALSKMIMGAVRSVVDETGMSNYTLEELADLFAQAYYAVIDESEDVPAAAVAKFIVAGKLSNGKLGAIQIIAKDRAPEVEVIEAQRIPRSLIFPPEDLTIDECDKLFKQAIHSINEKKKVACDPIEAIHREAVRNVSRCSRYVGMKSDYITIYG